jgi:glycosyltransferase involved in cell wall biosynthesis
VKILAVHNFYGSAAPSGENKAFETETALLERRGHDVRRFVRHSDDLRRMGGLGMVRGAIGTPWNPFAARALQRTVEEFRPDVVHVHNTFPMLSPAIFHAIGTRAARVLTLHNYRLFCSAAIPMRAGRVCTECLDQRSVLPALRHGCYRGSRIATLPLATSVALHRALGTWTNEVDAFLALSEFQRERMVDAGLPRERVHVKPSFFPGNPAVVPWSEREPVVVFAGRLTAEKGVESLIRAWQSWGESSPELRIIGAGDLLPELERLAAGARVRFLGALPLAATHEQIARARLLVLPSECFEGSPLVLAEAFAFGTPAAVSNVGPLPSIVTDGENGLVFEAGTPSSLLETVRRSWDSPGLLEHLGSDARRVFERLYTEDSAYDILTRTYDAALSVSADRRSTASP